MKKAQRTLEDVILDFILPCKESTLYLDIVVKTEIKRAERLATAIRSYYLSILPEKITIDNQDDYDDETNDEELYRFGWCAAIDEMKKRIGG